MIAVDTNILVHAHRADSEWNAAAVSALQQLDSRHQRWAIPWPCVYEFFSIVTHPRIFRDPTPPNIAWDALMGFVESDSVRLLSEEAGYLERSIPLLRPLNLRGPKVHDARIAALCHFHRVSELWSQDRDFSRFPFLKVTNPLATRR